MRRKELADGAGLNGLRRATENGVWIIAIPRRLNDTELSWEEFQDNLILRYGIVPLNLPIDWVGCVKKLLVPHALSCPKGGLVLARHNDAAKEWGALSTQSINTSDISYKPKINNGTVQGERNRDRARVATGEREGGEQDDKEGATGQATVPDKSRADASIHGLWKWGTTDLFDMRIVNLDVGSYLRQTSAKALAMAEKDKKDK